MPVHTKFCPVPVEQFEREFLQMDQREGKLPSPPHQAGSERHGARIRLRMVHVPSVVYGGHDRLLPHSAFPVAHQILEKHAGDYY